MYKIFNLLLNLFFYIKKKVEKTNILFLVEKEYSIDGKPWMKWNNRWEIIESGKEWKVLSNVERSPNQIMKANTDAPSMSSTTWKRKDWSVPLWHQRKAYKIYPPIMHAFVSFLLHRFLTFSGDYCFEVRFGLFLKIIFNISILK